MAKGSLLEGIRHVRPARPLRFPSSDPELEMGQSLRHLRLCELLHLILRAAVQDRGSVGADQFVYFDAGQPRRCVAPDGFVKLGVPQELFDSWKTWERGAPELAVEVLSPSDTREPWTLDEKLARYDALGVRELLVYDADAAPGSRLRAWDRVGDDWIERVVERDATPCTVLGLHWVIAPGEDLPAGLRLALDPGGLRLVKTPEEREREAKEAEREAKEAEREAKEAEREAKEAEREAKEREREAKEAALAEVERLRALLDR